jgi:hypothetical protein
MLDDRDILMDRPRLFDPETARLPCPAARWKRLPVIRHIRAFLFSFAVDRHYRDYAKLGRVAVHRRYDDRCIKAIWRGDL